MEKNIRNREREQGKKKAAMKKRRRRKAIITFLVFFVIILALIFALVSAFLFFRVSDITLNYKSAYYSDNEIVGVSNIEIKDSLFLISKKSIIKNLTEKLPYIKTAEVDKKFPSTVIISTTETKNELCVLTNGKYYAADKDGKILASLSKPLENLPLFTLPDECVANIGKTIEIENTALDDLFYKYIDLLSLYSFKIDSVDIKDIHNSSMKVDGRLNVDFGSANYFDMKAAHFNTTFSKMSTEAEGRVDLSSWTPQKQEAFFTASEF